MNDTAVDGTLITLRENHPLLVVLSGPSGVGKDAVLTKMKARNRPRHFVITATTRPMRSEEVDGRDYHFLSPEEFDRMLAQDGFLEWALVYGHRYGVPKDQVRQALSQGLEVIIKADVQGAATIKKLVPEAVFIFLVPSSMTELEERLRQRKTESAVDLNLRIQTARTEMKCLPMFDYVVMNREGQMDEAVAQIDAIITAEKCRVRPRKISV